jgi:hypothetical protein
MSLGKGQKISKANYFALISLKQKRKKIIFLILPYRRIILAKKSLLPYTKNLIKGPRSFFAHLP